MEIYNNANDIKPFTEMSNRELFCILAGDKGIMAQMLLQKLIKGYMAAHTEEADLQTMVRIMTEEGIEE